MRQQTIGTNAAAVYGEPQPQFSPDAVDLLNWVGFGVYFKNFGRVGTGDFIANATLTRKTIPSYRQIGKVENKVMKQSRLMPMEQTGPAGMGRDVAMLKFNTVLTEHEMTELKNGKEEIELAGDIEYDNGFGDKIHEPFCFLYFVTPTKLVQQSNLGYRGWSRCDLALQMIKISQNWSTADNQDHK